MTFLLYCLSIFFVYHLYNRSDIAESARQWAATHLHEHVLYALGCAFCLTFHVSLIGAVVGLVPAIWVLAAPVINLFAIKALDKLS